MPLRILQVCNVGQVLGGTAACAWTVARSFPRAEHTILFLSPISGETRAAFRFATLLRRDRLTSEDVLRLAPHAALLHNTPRHRVETPLPTLTLQYLHSRITPAPADLTVYCSQWLAHQYGDPNPRVLYQPVPIPPHEPHCASGERDASNQFRPQRTSTFAPPIRPLRSCARRSPEPGEINRPFPGARATRPNPVVGRLCTPQSRKWPADFAEFYGRLATEFPRVQWEFVGCPPSLHALFRRACRDRAVFREPAWSARAHLWRWDALLYHHPTLAESFGRTAAEAQRAGCLPIVDNRGGFREQVVCDRVPQNGIECLCPPRSATRVDTRSAATGWLCDSPGDFAAAIDQLHDPGTRWRMSRAARAHANERFSLARFSQDLTALVRTAVPGAGTPQG